MRFKLLFLISFLISIITLTAYAGSLDSPAPPNDPASASFTLEDMWYRMNDGTAGSKVIFTQPASGPTAGTGHTINEIMGIAPTADNTSGASVNDVLNGKTFWGLRTDGTWGPKTGTLTTQTIDNTTTNQAAGFYNAFNLATVEPDLVTGNIKSGVSIFGLAGAPNVVDTTEAANPAGAPDILFGKKAFVNGLPVTGTLATQTVDNTTINQTAGFYNGFNLATIEPDLASENIKKGANIFGILGDINVLDTTEAASPAGQGDILTGKKAYVNGVLITGNVPAGASVNGGEGLKSFVIPDGLYSGSKLARANDADLVAGNIKNGVNILGVTGSAIQASGAATAGDVLSGVTFSNASGASTGTMPNNGTVNITPGTAAQTIAAGYHNGSGSVAGDADLVAGNIKDGVEVFGVTGTYPLGPVAKTGRTGCWDASGNPITCTGTGQDGEYQKGVTWPNPRFTDNGDGTVTDNLTKLIWLKDANFANTAGYDPDLTGDGRVNWQNALNFVSNLNSGAYEATSPGRCGYTDWRLPNRFELESLLYLQYYSPPLSNAAGTGQWTSGDPFTGVQLTYYWSSTTGALNLAYAWTVYLSGGSVSGGNKTDDNYVWPVRGGQ